MRQCVEKGLKEKLENFRAEIDSALKEIAESGNSSAQKARETFEEETEQLQGDIIES